MNGRMRKLLVEFIRHETIVTSWGLSNIKMLDNQIFFNVNALKYKGCIKISTSIEKSDSYIINLVSVDNQEIIVPLSKVVPILDSFVETTDLYYSDLIEWFNHKHT